MFYNNLIKVCIKKNTTINAVLTKLGKQNSGISSSWKNGTIPKIDIVSKISDILEVSTDELIKGIDNKLSNDEQFLLDTYRKLSNESKIMIKAKLIEEIKISEEKRTSDWVTLPSGCKIRRLR